MVGDKKGIGGVENKIAGLCRLIKDYGVTTVSTSVLIVLIFVGVAERRESRERVDRIQKEYLDQSSKDREAYTEYIKKQAKLQLMNTTTISDLVYEMGMFRLENNELRKEVNRLSGEVRFKIDKEEAK